jgi:Uma2 family endonuclease
MSTSTVPITAPTIDQFLDMHFDGPVELVCGEIVELTRLEKSHGNVCSEVAFAITAWARKSNAGRVTTNDGRIVTEPVPGTVRGTDVAYFAANQLTHGKLPRGPMTLVPVLCVEVLSPSNTWSEMRRKIEEYLAAGVHEVWLVDPKPRTVETFRSDSRSALVRESQTLTSLELPGFSTLVADFFAGVE